MNGQPYFSLGIEDTAKVTPSHSKTGLCFYGFQVARLSIQKWAAKRGEQKMQGQALQAIKEQSTGSERNSRERENQSKTQ